MSRIYLSPPEVNGIDREMLLAAVDSNWIAPVGPDLELFEGEVAARCGRSFGVGLSSGTAGLHLALLELGVGSGDEVLVSTFTFAATANAVVYCGATPVFIDADPETWQMSPNLLAEAIRQRRAAGAHIAAAIVVDLYGQCADYDRIIPILDEAEIPLIEDAAEALGATYRDRSAGGFGKAAILSFNGNKIITTSGGGMLVTNDESFAARIRHLATQARQPAAHYEHAETGFNYRLSNLLAAFGRGQLQELEARVDRRRLINERYRQAFAEISELRLMPTAPYGRPTFWLTSVTIESAVLGVDREAVRQLLEAEDIESRPTWKPMHLQPVYAHHAAIVDGTSQRIFDTGLCLPSGGNLSVDDQARVVDLVRDKIGWS